MPAYIKKDKDHDVLGNLINPKRLFLPADFFKIIKIGKRTFFYTPMDGLQCCMCLNRMQILVEEKEKAKNGIRRLYIPDECACTRQVI